MIRTKQDLCQAVMQFGFLPFFRSVIYGLSLEDMADRSIWFPPDGMGAWDWKEDVIKATGGAYGSFFAACPGFVSRDMIFPLLSYRRNGYDFEGFANDGHAKKNERRIYGILEETGEDTLEDEESQEDEEAWEESNDQEDAQDEEEEQSFQPSMAW